MGLFSWIGMPLFVPVKEKLEPFLLQHDWAPVQKAKSTKVWLDEISVENFNGLRRSLKSTSLNTFNVI